MALNKFHYFLYTKELLVYNSGFKQSNTFIAYGYKVTSVPKMSFDDMTSAVESFELSKKEKEDIWIDLAEKTVDGL